METLGRKNPDHISKIQSLWIETALKNYGYKTTFHNVLYFFLPCEILDKLKIPATGITFRLVTTISHHLSHSLFKKIALTKTHVIMSTKQN